MGIGLLLEGFAPAMTGPPKSWGGRFDLRDNVNVKVKGGDVTGRVLRASGARPDTHVIIDPGGGQAHIEAEVSKVKLHTPESYAVAAQRAEAAAQAQQGQGGPPGSGQAAKGAGAGGAVREASIGILFESFDEAKHPRGFHGRFKVGDVVRYRTPSIVNGKVEGYGPPQTREVSGLQRNGYLRLKDAATGTTVDVHHSNAEYAPPVAGEQAERQAAAVRDRKLAAVRAAYEDRKLRVPSKSIAFREYKAAEAPIRAEYNAAISATADALRGARAKHPQMVPVAESVLGSLLEAFAAAPPPVTPAQSNAQGAKQVAAAKTSLAAGWNASKHPRAHGGKFGYTTGGQRVKSPRRPRATRSQASGSRTVGVGARGTMVKALQRQLGVKQDGIFGQQTRAAVERFQTQHGLQKDGVVGRQTLAGLRGNPNAAKITPGPVTSKTARVARHKTQRVKRAKPNRYSGGLVI